MLGRMGREPQPGLALLRLAQSSENSAAAAIRRTLGETAQPLKRAALLPAFVEIVLAVADVEQARTGCRERDEIAARQGSDVLAAMSAHARGALALAEGDAPNALAALRQAWHAWEELEAPYEAARTRVLVAVACRALGDDEAAALELGAAREVLARLGAETELARIDSLADRESPDRGHGLTDRELEVLRLVAAGKSNHAIAVGLHLSDHRPPTREVPRSRSARDRRERAHRCSATPLPPGPGRIRRRLPVGGPVARRASGLPRSGYPRHHREHVLRGRLGVRNWPAAEHSGTGLEEVTAERSPKRDAPLPRACWKSPASGRRIALSQPHRAGGAR
jgi:hypothetical protein